MKIGIVYKKCAIKNKIEIAYFSTRLALRLCLNAILLDKKPEQPRAVWLPYGEQPKYFNDTTQALINFGITNEEYIDNVKRFKPHRFIHAEYVYSHLLKNLNITKCG